MLKQQARFLIVNAIFVDALLLGVAFVFGYSVRDFLLPAVFPDHFGLPLFGLSSYLWLYVVTVPLCLGSLAFVGLYTPVRFTTFRHIPVDTAKAVGLAFSILIGLTYLLKVQDLSRSFVTAFAGSAVLFVSLGRLMVRESLRRQGQRDYTLSNVLIVGTDDKAQAFADLVRSSRKWGVNLIGLLAENRYGTFKEYAGQHRVIGNLDDLERICHRHVVDEVIFVVPGKILSDMEDLFLLCEELGVNARIAVGIFPHLIARATLDHFGHIPLLTFTTRPTNWAALAVKRAVDLLIAWPLAIVGMPLWLVLALLIKLDSSGPILFCQERCGLNGRRFTMYKFRSMVADAELRMCDVLSLNELTGPVFKMRKDPRMTRVGRFLRKTSLDECPQLLNVIKGDMSIVGPRPAIPAEVDKYERWQRRRLSMKPGLTSLWVVRGRNTIPFEQWMQYDLEYIDNWSLRLDLTILIETIPVVLTGRGAS